MTNFHIESSALKVAFNRLKEVINRGTVLPQLECILVEVLSGCVRFTASDLETYLRLEVPCRTSILPDAANFSFLIDHRQVSQMMKNVFPTTVTFKVGESKAIISFDRFTFKLSTLPFTDFPKYNDGKDELMFGTFAFPGLKKQLMVACDFASRDDLRPQMCGVNFTKIGGIVTIAATDAHRLYFKNVVGFDTSKDTFQFTLPTKALKIACNNFKEPADISESTSHIRLSQGGTLLITRKIDGNFPEWRKVVPDHKEWPALYVNRKDLLTGLKIASPFSNSSTHQVVVSMKFEQATPYLFLSAEDVDFSSSGEFSLEVVLGTIEDGHVFGINSKFLLHSLTTSTENQAKLTYSGKATSPIIINDEILIMPLMLNN